MPIGQYVSFADEIRLLFLYHSFAYELTVFVRPFNFNVLS